MPDKIDWDGLIADVLQRGTDVPEVPWFKPGEDAAYDVSSLICHSFFPVFVPYISTWKYLHKSYILSHTSA